MRILLLILLTSNLFSQTIDIIDRSDNNIELGCDFDDNGVLLLSDHEIDNIQGITKGILFKNELSLNDINEVDPQVWELFKVEQNKLYSFKINDLKAKNTYYLYLSTPEHFKQIFTFKTLEKKPLKPSSNIVFRKTAPGSIELFWSNGLGSNRMVLVSKGRLPELPVNGLSYNSGKYGSDSSRIGFSESYVVFNGKIPENRYLKLDSLEYDLYYFNIVEYNGKGDQTNYLPGNMSSNPRSQAPRLEAPIASSNFTIVDDEVLIDWNDVKYSDYYEIQVSYDEDFSELIPEYQNSDVGSQSEFAIFFDDPNKKIFWRVRAVGKYNKSDFSNTIEVAP